MPHAASDCWRADHPPARAPAARTRSRSGVRRQTAKASLAAAIFLDGALECGAVEIRPVDRHEHELAIGGLPQQEVRQALLTAGADDHVWIGNVGRVQMRAETLG